jgi:Sodium/calcium exchanger protein
MRKAQESILECSAERESSQSDTLAVGFRAGCASRCQSQTRSAHLTVCTFGDGHCPDRSIAEPCDRVRCGKTGDAVGGLLNATLGNLTELVIVMAALRAGEYMPVRASIAGAIVTNTLFMLGASFLIGGLRHHVQEFNRSGARLQAGLLLLATVALLMPSAIAEADSHRPPRWPKRSALAWRHCLSAHTHWDCGSPSGRIAKILEREPCGGGRSERGRLDWLWRH